jgi:tape measure domain-containing protein
MPAQEVTLKFNGDPAHLLAALKQISAAHDTSLRGLTRQAAAQAREEARAERAQVRASEQLQRQRSAAFIRIWNAEARERVRIAKEAEREAARAARGPDFASILGFSGGVAGGLSALVGVSVISEIRAGAAAWVNYASKLESTRIAFTTMLGSSQRAETHLKELQSFALATPFQFEELIDASQRMQALGFEAEQVIPILTDVGNAVAAAGGGSERLDRVVLALSQIQSKGRVMTQELNQLAEAGISGFKILEQQLGKSRAELVQMVEAGEISSAVFIEAFQKFSRQNFGGLMEKQAKTFTGAMSNIKDSALALSTTALAPLFKQLTDGTLATGRWAVGLQGAATGVSNLMLAIERGAPALSAFGSAKIWEILTKFPGLIQGAELAGRGLEMLGTPEITAPSVSGVRPVPLPTGESQALLGEAEKVSALRAASEEAKRIANERIANAERAFRLGTITREAETENIITQLRIRAEAERKALEIEIGRKTSEILANRDNAEKVAQIIEQVGNLKQQAKNAESALEREIADKRAAFQIQERQNLIEHEQRKRDIVLSAGMARIAVIDAEVRSGIKSALDGAAQVEAIEQESFAARKAFLDIQLANAGKEPAEREKITHLIEQLEIERTTNQQKQADRRREITREEGANELALNQQLVAIRQAQREGELARIEAMLSVQIISESTAIAARMSLLKQDHEDRMSLLEIERQQLTTSTEKKVELDNKKLESEQRFTDEVKRLSQERIDAIIRELAAREGGPGISTGVQGGGVQPGFPGEPGMPPPVPVEVIDSWTILKQASMDALVSMGQGIGDLVQQWVIYGTVGPNAVRKMLAAVLAAAAAQAAVEAIMQLAHAAKEFALGLAAASNPFTAAMAPGHFAAAAAHVTAAGVYGAVAGVAAVSGRLVAGNAFQSAAGTSEASGGSSTSGRGEIQTIEADRRQRSQSSQLPPITVVISGEAGAAFDYKVVRAVIGDHRLNGDVRTMVETGRV